MAEQWTNVLFKGELSTGTPTLISPAIDISNYSRYTIQVYSDNPAGSASIKLSSTTKTAMGSTASPFSEDAIASFSAGAYVPAFQVISSATLIPINSKYMQITLQRVGGSTGNVTVIGTFQG